MMFAFIAIGAGVALLAVWLLPRAQARSWVTDRGWSEFENSVRGTVVQVVGGLAVVLTFAATWSQLLETRDVSERTLQLTAEQQMGERFSRAIEQLGFQPR